jgi:hypothetical protein
MNIQTVLDNLDNTIVGKEKYLAECNNAELTETTDRIHRATIVGMLELNISELKRIRADVALCPQAAFAGSSCA